MSDAHVTAAVALREATGALTAGAKTGSAAGRIDQAEAPELAYAVTQHLDALMALLRTVDLDPVPTSSVERSLHAVARHLQQTAGLARRTAGGDVPLYSDVLHEKPDPAT